MLHENHFTLEEARKTLAEIMPMVGRMVELKEKLNNIGYDIYRHQYFGGIGPNGTGEFPEELEELITIIQDISEKNVIIKGIDSGLLDFPSLRDNGEEVYLCFKYGEEDILFWHSVEEGFPGRKSVDDL